MKRIPRKATETDSGRKQVTSTGEKVGAGKLHYGSSKAGNLPLIGSRKIRSGSN